MKKQYLVLIMMILFLIGFSYSARVFSEEEVQMQFVRGENGHIILKIFAPSSIKTLYTELYNRENIMVAGLHLDYYGIEKLKDNDKNTFLIKHDRFKNRKDMVLKLFPRTAREETFYLKDVEEIVEKDDQQKDTKDINQLKVMSFNIHHGRDKLGFHTLDQISEIILEHNVDIVGLQEVDKRVIRSKFEDQVKQIAKKTNMYYAFAPAIRFMGSEYGNAILSRYPIEGYYNVKLSGFRENRGLMVSKINLSSQKINFLVTHLGLTKEEKEKQFEVLEKYIAFLGEKTILVGDFNSREDHIGIQKLKKHLIDTAARTDGYHQHTYDGLMIKSRIDYIFASPDVQTMKYEVIETNISDHFPIVASLTW